MTEEEQYKLVANLVMHSEQILWTRFNKLLLLSSILMATWVVGYSGLEVRLKFSMLLTLLALPGFQLGIIWSRLGARSSVYLDTYHKQAEELEDRIGNLIAMPFHSSVNTRKTARFWFGRLSSSRWIITWIPIVFYLLFLAFIILSWL